VYSQNHGPNFIRIGPPPVVARTHKSYQYNCFGVSYLQGVAHYSQNHASDTGGGWAFQIVALTHKNNRDNFFIVSGPPKNLRVLTKSWSRILFGSAHRKLLLVLTSYQYNCFLNYQPTSKVLLVQKIMHPTPADGPPFRLLLLQE
jgi:hypothetical protein